MKIPQKHEFERSFRRSLVRSKVILLFEVLFIFFSVAVFINAPDTTLRSSLTIFASIGLGLWLLLMMGKVLFLHSNSVRLDLWKEDTIGNFTKKEVSDMLNQVFSEFKKKEIPTIYVLKVEALNAFTVDTYILNFFRPLNALYITKPMFSKLNKKELHAIILHETGHFYKYMYADLKFSLPEFICLLLPFGFVVLFPGIVSKLFFLFFAFILVFKCLSYSLKRNDHELEFLSDLFAASRVGKLNMINALIIIGSEYKNLPQKTRVINKLAEKSAIKDKRVLIRWSEFDTYIRNSKIEPQEYEQFINTILEQENAKVLESEIDEESPTHPTLTNRILFMHYNC